MKRYFAVYRCLLILNYHRVLTHKTDFLNGLISSLLWGAFSIIAIYVLTSRSSSVFGWSRAEIFVLTGVFNILVGGTFRMLFSRNFDRFTHIIQYGELDGVLLKPLNPQFALSFWHIGYSHLFRVVIAIVYTAFALSYAHVSITLFSCISFLFLSILGIIELYSIWFLVMTCIIWIPDVYNLVELLYTTDNLTRYPPLVLWSMRLAVFVLLFPLTLVVSVPTKALLHTVTSFDILLLACFSFGLIFCSRLFWNFALRYYTSASG